MPDEGILHRAVMRLLNCRGPRARARDAAHLPTSRISLSVHVPCALLIARWSSVRARRGETRPPGRDVYGRKRAEHGGERTDRPRTLVGHSLRVSFPLPDFSSSSLPAGDTFASSSLRSRYSLASSFFTEERSEVLKRGFLAYNELQIR